MNLVGRKPKLTPTAVRELRSRRANGEPLAAIARHFGLAYSNAKQYAYGRHKRRYA